MCMYVTIQTIWHNITSVLGLRGRVVRICVREVYKPDTGKFHSYNLLACWYILARIRLARIDLQD